MIGALLDLASRVKARLDGYRLERRWESLRRMGMRIGHNVNLPASTWIDTSHCYLISIGDHSGFGEQCLLLAHDAQMDEFLDAARIGRIIIHPSCHIGSRTTILPGVEIGPRTIVGAGSVVSHSLPPDTVCAGSPASVLCSLEEYLASHRQRLASRPKFDYMTHVRSPTPERRAEQVAAVAEGDAYVTGGRSAGLRGEGGPMRTSPRP
jgi:maltose O-acetyltransferase